MTSEWSLRNGLSGFRAEDLSSVQAGTSSDSAFRFSFRISFITDSITWYLEPSVCSSCRNSLCMASDSQFCPEAQTMAESEDAVTGGTYLSLEIAFALSYLFFQTLDRLIPFWRQLFLSLLHFHQMLFFCRTMSIRVSVRREIAMITVSYP